MTAQGRTEEELQPLSGGDEPTTLAEEVSVRPPRRRLRMSLVVLAGITVASATAIASTGVLGGDGDSSTPAAVSGPAKTAKVQRATLVRTETVDGSLGYGDATSVQATPAAAGQESAQGGQAAQSSGSGIITWLPDAGDVITRGKTVYNVDERQVPLLYGSTPLYRTLDIGSAGKDVRLLEQNLAALGYKGFTVDAEYTSGTAEAVKDWQDDLGRDETGTVQPADAVVATGERRVANVSAALGAAPTGEILAWTAGRRIISVNLEVQYEDLVVKGTKATVKLPDGTTVEAEVTDVGTAAVAPSDSGSGGGMSSDSSDAKPEDATLPVEIEVKDQKKLGRYQAAPVDVTLSADTRENVLVVPVNALVALREGGYGLEVVEKTGTRYVAVKLGMFADGRVEVSGPDVTEGTVVGVPK